MKPANVRGFKKHGYTLMLKSSSKKMSSRSMTLLNITLKEREILQNIGRRVVGNDPMNISPSSMLLNMLLAERQHWNIIRLLFAAANINRLRLKC